MSQPAYELTKASKVLLIAGSILGLVMGVTMVWAPTISGYLFGPGQLLYVIAMMLPQFGYVAILLALKLRQAFVAMSLAAAMSVIPIGGFPIFFLMYFGSKGEQIAPFVVVFWPAWILLLGVAASVSMGKHKALSLGAAVLGTFVGIIAVFTVYSLQYRGYAVAFKRGTYKEHQKESLAKAYVVINGCAQQYRAAHPQSGFPRDLKELADGPSACLPKDLASGKIAGFKVRYHPVFQPGGTNVIGYRVTSRWDSLLEWRSSSLDTSDNGVIVEHGWKNIQRLPYQGAGIEGYRMTWNVMADARIAMFADPKWVLPADLRFHRWPREDSDAGRTIVTREYSLEYTRTDTRKFVVKTRPVRYGETGVRSYYADETGVVHGTPEDRDAAVADPPAFCEGGGQCD